MKEWDVPGWQQMLFQSLYVPFRLNGAFTDVQVPHAKGTNAPPWHHRCWLLNFGLVTIRMVLLSPKDTKSIISKTI